MSDWRNRLLLRWGLTNIIGLMLIGYAWYSGLASAFILGDSSRVSLLICAVFFVTMFAGGARVIETSRDMDKSSDRLQNSLGSQVAYELKLENRRTPFRLGIQVVEYLGVLGTVYGLVQAIAAHDATDIRMGVAIALYPTVISTVTTIWLFLNQQLLSTGLIKLQSKALREASHDS